MSNAIDTLSCLAFCWQCKSCYTAMSSLYRK